MPAGALHQPRRTKAEMDALMASLPKENCSCGHFAVSAAAYYERSHSHAAGRACVACFRERERERQRGYREASNPSDAVNLKTAGHAYAIEKSERDPEVEAALGVLRDARAQRQGKQGYVYCIIEDIPGGGFSKCKVGYSVNPSKRVAELQTGNPRPLRVLCLKAGTPADEKALHAKYIKDNILQEWFYATKELLLEFDLDSSGRPFADADDTKE